MEHKNKFLLFVVFAFVASSCNMAHFNRFPGTKLDQVPTQYLGFYEDPTGKDTSTILVLPNSWVEFGTKPKTHPIGDSMVISEYKKNHFISFRNESNPYWEVYLAKQNKKMLYLYPALYSPTGEKKLQHLAKHISPKMDADSTYWFEMNEEELLKYFKKNINKDDALKFKKKTNKP